jgi:hypothetical protein
MASETLNNKDLFMGKAFGSSQHDSVLTHLRQSFLEELNQSRELNELEKRIHKSIAKNNWLSAWFDAQKEFEPISQRDEQVKKNLNSVQFPLTQYVGGIDWPDVKGIECPTDDWNPFIRSLLFGTGKDGDATSKYSQPKETRFPPLVGVSLMYVSPHFNEIYYTDTHSDFLPDATIRFVENSVFVPRVARLWKGSVGKAIVNKEGAHCVPNSFLDEDGVVACEDLIEGNISILMKCIYRDESSEKTADQVLAVAFCFLPIPDAFTEAELKHFNAAVRKHAYGIRLWCRAMEAEVNNGRLHSLIQTHETVSDGRATSKIAEAVLDALIASDTKHNAVGAIIGIYYDAKERGALTTESVRICGSFLEREIARATRQDELGKLLDMFSQLCGNIIRIDVGPWARITVYRLGDDTGAEIGKFPDELTLVFWDLWEVFINSLIEHGGYQNSSNSTLDSEQKLALTHMEHERLKEVCKIAADMFSALLGQVILYLSNSCRSPDLSEDLVGENLQIRHNISVILKFWTSYITGQGREYSTETTYFADGLLADAFLAALDKWSEAASKNLRPNVLLMLGEVRPFEEIWSDLPTADVGDTDRQSVSTARSPNNPSFVKEHLRPWRTGINTAEINNRLFHKILVERLRNVPIKVSGREEDIENDIIDYLWSSDDHSILRTVALALGLDKSTAHHSIERVKVGKKTKGLLLLLSLEPLMEDVVDCNVQKDTQNSVVRLATAFHSAVMNEGMATLASYAQGASHGLKNALIIPELLLGYPRKEGRTGAQKGWPERCRPLFDKQATGRLEISGQMDVRTLIDRAIRVRREVIHLKEQAQLFFWIMSPDRAISDAAAQMGQLHVSLRRVIGETALRGLLLTLARLMVKETLHLFPYGEDPDRRLTELEGAIFELQEAWDDTVDDKLDLPGLLSEISSKSHLTLRTDFDWSLLNIRLIGIDSTVAKAVFLELFQNAIKAAILSKSDSPEVIVSCRENERDAATSVAIANSASADHMETLKHGWNVENPDESAGGVRGLWQLRLLCKELVADRIDLTLDRPSNKTAGLQLESHALPVQITTHFLSEVKPGLEVSQNEEISRMVG